MDSTEEWLRRRAEELKAKQRLRAQQQAADDRRAEGAWAALKARIHEEAEKWRARIGQLQKAVTEPIATGVAEDTDGFIVRVGNTHAKFVPHDNAWRIAQSRGVTVSITGFITSMDDRRRDEVLKEMFDEALKDHYGEA
jgi:hypothetical protein